MEQRTFGTVRAGAGLLLLLMVPGVVAGCDGAQLLAPTKSTITVSAPTRVLPTGGSTEVTALVVEQAGTPVANGTTVRFSTSLGRVDPVEAQTRNGVATTTFFAMSTSGIARITAVSGAATAPSDNANMLEITIGAAAVNTVTLRANPGSVGPNGGAVELIATVVAENGRALEEINVTFNADQGMLSSNTAVTNANGEARTTLTTSQQSIVSATAGTKTSSNVTITVRAGPIVTITCAPTTATAAAPGNCAALQASPSNNSAAVVLTVTRPTGSSTLRTATLDFGDGTSQALGNLAGGSVTIIHTYAGPTDMTPRVYTATVTAVDINGESAVATTTVNVLPRALLSVTISAGTPGTPTAGGQLWTFTATAKEGTADATVQSYSWDFGDGDNATTSGNVTSHVYATVATEQKRTVTVTARTPDGRTSTARTEILVGKFP